MRRSYLVEIAHKALQAPDRLSAENLLDSVNLSLREREVIVRSELDKASVETICNSFTNWGRKSVCSQPHMHRIKKNGMEKIGRYLETRQASETVKMIIKRW